MSELTEKISDRTEELGLPDFVDTVREKVASQTHDVVANVQNFVDSQDLTPVTEVAEDLSRRARGVGHEISDRAQQLGRRFGREPSRWEVWFESTPRFMLLIAGAGLTGAAAGWLTRERATSPESNSQPEPAPSRGSETMSPRTNPTRRNTPPSRWSAGMPRMSARLPRHPEHLTGDPAADEPELASDSGPLAQRAHDAQSAYPSNDQPDIEADEDMADEGPASPRNARTPPPIPHEVCTEVRQGARFIAAQDRSSSSAGSQCSSDSEATSGRSWPSRNACTTRGSTYDDRAIAGVLPRCSATSAIAWRTARWRDSRGSAALRLASARRPACQVREVFAVPATPTSARYRLTSWLDTSHHLRPDL